MANERYVVIEGPIGVGKSAVAERLAERLAARALFDAAEENPFLPRYYHKPAAHAFSTQVYFLLSRYQQQLAVHQQDLFKRSVVADYLFARDRIYAHQILDDDELALYRKIYDLLAPHIVRPDLVVFLQARVDVLMRRIRQRNRPADQDLSAGYLADLVEAYNDFFFYYDETPLLVVNTSEINVLESAKDMDDLLGEIVKARAGVEHYVPPVKVK